MMAMLKFLKKELMEIIKTHRIFVLPALFLFFGFLGPLSAKFTPELIKALGNGIKIELPPVTYLDSYDQLFKNLNQLGFIIMILVFMGIVVDEKVKGSAVLVLTKGLSRTWFILDKFFASVLLFTFSFLLSSLACIYYTYLLFQQFYNASLIPALLFLWLYGVFIIAAATLASTIAKSHIISAVVAFITFIAFSSIGVLPKIGSYSPSTLGGIGQAMMRGTKQLGDAVIPLISGLVLIIVFLTVSIISFKRQEL